VVVRYNIAVKSRTIAVFAALGLFLVLVAATQPASARSGTYANRLADPRAHAGESKTEVDTDGYVGTRGWRSGTFVVGDSVTRIGLIDGLRELGLGTGWEVSSVSGREVSTLPYYLRDRAAAQQPLPPVKHTKRWKRRHPHARPAPRFKYPLRRAVIALGTNATQGWTYGDLRAATNLLPATAVVVFVTPFRDATLWPETGPFRVRASVSAVYASWEKRIAELRPHTCIADWRAFALRYPSAVHDGVHETYAGAGAWARIVSSAVDRCR
jgi:hypothetical protein